MPCRDAPALDARRYERCAQQARAELLGAGFDPNSKKLPDAVRRRALSKYRRGLPN